MVTAKARPSHNPLKARRRAKGGEGQQASSSPGKFRRIWPAFPVTPEVGEGLKASNLQGNSQQIWLPSPAIPRGGERQQASSSQDKLQRIWPALPVTPADGEGEARFQECVTPVREWDTGLPNARKGSASGVISPDIMRRTAWRTKRHFAARVVTL